MRHGHLTISHNHYLDTPRKLGPFKVGSDARALQICFWCRIVTWIDSHLTKESAMFANGRPCQKRSGDVDAKQRLQHFAYLSHLIVGLEPQIGAGRAAAADHQRRQTSRLYRQRHEEAITPPLAPPPTRRRVLAVVGRVAFIYCLACPEGPTHPGGRRLLSHGCGGGGGNVVDACAHRCCVICGASNNLNGLNGTPLSGLNSCLMGCSMEKTI